MFTIDTVLDSLRNFGIDEATLQSWEKELGLQIPVDEFGRKTYSPHHINLFKNVKKHLALGRSLSEIKKVIALPPSAESRPLSGYLSGDAATTSYRSSQNSAVVLGSAASSGGTPSAAVAEYPLSKSGSHELQGAKPSDIRKPSQYASVPPRPYVTASSMQPSREVIQLIDKLLAEKDNLQRRVVDTEKLNSHLYNANNMFHRKVKELNGVIQELREKLREDYQIKLLDDKDKLHKQLLMVERDYTQKLKEIEKTVQEKNLVIEQKNQIIEQKNLEMLTTQGKIQEIESQLEIVSKHLVQTNTQMLATLEEKDVAFNRAVQEKDQEIIRRIEEKDRQMMKRLEEKDQEQMKRLEEKDRELEIRCAEIERQLTQPFDPKAFTGDWEEIGELLDVVYDNFGINVEPRRHRIFRIADVPERYYGKAAIINTQYEYESNTLWKRHETLIASIEDSNRMEGELTSEYIIDGVPVAKAVYRIHCTRIAGS